MDRPSHALAVPALAAIGLAAADLVTFALLPGSRPLPGAASLVFVVLAAGALGTLLLPLVPAFWQLGLKLSPKRSWPVVAGTAGGLVIALLNLEFWGGQTLFLAALVVGGVLYCASLAWVALRPHLAWSAVLVPAAILLYAIDATQLRGLYHSQHLTVSLLTWVTLMLGLAKAVRLLWPRGRVGLVLTSGPTLLVALGVAVFWLAPGDAIGVDVRHGLLNGSTASRSALQMLAPMTDVDRDGYGLLLGHGDCEPFDAQAHPGAREVAGDGIDQNCLAGDPDAEVARAFSARTHSQVGADRPATVDNVLLITVDALRVDRVRGPRANPVLRRLALQGTFFARAYCLYPGTVPSVYGLVVSDYPSAVTYTPYRNFEFPMDDERTTLFEVLERAGIRQFGAFYHRMLTPRFGITRGLAEIWAPADSAAGISAALTTEQGLAFLEQARSERFFLWLHYFDPHAPYEVDSGETDPGTDEARYDLEVARVAGEIERFLARAEATGALDRTAVILAADHGEEFGDHGATHHGQSVYDESTRVPLSIRLPGTQPALVETPVSFVDLAPTILALLDLDSLQPASWKGVPLTPYLAGGEVEEPYPVFLEAYRPGGAQKVFGVVLANHKLVYRPEQQLIELYDLAADPEERRNLWGRQETEGLSDALLRLLDLHLAVNL